MSSHSTKARLASVVLAAIAVLAVVAGAAIGWFGLPQSEAAAAANPAADHARFARVVANAVPQSAQDRIMAPAKKKVVIRKRNVRTVRALAAGPWSKAKVSWYGPGFYGNTMAGGGKLRRDSMVVAHKSMKFGTRILFRYKGRTVIAVVKDRGPYVSGRTFDLGPGTAKALRFQGVGTVKYRILKR